MNAISFRIVERENIDMIKGLLIEPKKHANPYSKCFYKFFLTI